MPMWPVILILVLVVVWYFISHFWADSTRHQQPILHDTVGQRRFGWKCQKCGRIHAPVCNYKGCRGPLLWTTVQPRRIRCSRCGQHAVIHPWLFKQLPIKWPVRCGQCGWHGMMEKWELD